MAAISLNWKGPYKLTRYHEVGESRGIYAISRKWGETAERILYIGETYFQEIRQRLSQHRWLNDLRGDVRIRVAGSRYSPERTRDIEALLICYYKPERNTHYRNCYEGRPLEIVSFGRRGPIGKVIRSSDL